MIWDFSFDGKLDYDCFFHNVRQENSVTTEQPIKTNEIVAKPNFFQGNVFKQCGCARGCGTG